MKRVGILFIGAVVLPSLLLAWLALRSLKDHELAYERQEHLVWQGMADQAAARARSYIDDLQRDFGQRVEGLVAKQGMDSIRYQFDPELCGIWPLAEVGFAVSTEGEIFSPSMLNRMEAREFRLANLQFLCNAESVEVYWNSPKGQINLTQLDRAQAVHSNAFNPAQGAELWRNLKESSENRAARKVTPQMPEGRAAELWATSELVTSETSFRELVGDAQEGVVSRFLENKLHVLLWYRSRQEPGIVFGAKLRLARLAEELRGMVRLDESSGQPAILALLDDQTRPVAVHPAGMAAEWRKPFAAAEIGEALPHWEMAVYLRDPKWISRSSHTTVGIIGLLVAVLMVAIGAGSWLIVSDVHRELRLARRKTDFVSHVSHELKTPLTSIRLFAELLADPVSWQTGKGKQYLGIIQRESERLTRLINNMLDVARLERDETPVTLAPCDLAEIARQTLDACRPQLEAGGFQVINRITTESLPVQGDRDALARIVVNLLSNAEKYSTERREITVELDAPSGNASSAWLRVLDRGPGVPGGQEEKIFEPFHRVQDELTATVAGSGLGLTLARRIARAHGGDLTCHAREGGGSVFAFQCPRAPGSVGQETASTPNSKPS